MGKANPDRMNGVNRSVHFLAQHQFRTGHDVVVWGLTADVNAPTPEREYPLILFTKRRNRFALAAELIDAIDALPQDSIIHFHGGLIVEYHAISRHLKRLGIPWVATPQSAYSPIALRRNRLVKRIYIQLIERRFLTECSAVQALSSAEVSWISQWCPRERIVIIPNGEEAKHVDLETAPLDRPRRPVFGYCGRLESYQKGLDLLLPAFAQYLHAGGKGVLWLIGDGESRKQLEEIVRREGIEDSVHFFGQQFGQEKVNRIAHMDFFVHTSRWEGIPFAVLEALALKRPLLISEGTNMGREVETYGCGHVVHEDSVECIAEGLVALEAQYDSGEWTEMSASAYELVNSVYSYSVISERIVNEMYSKNLSPHSSP